MTHRTPLRILLINQTPVPMDERAWLEARTLAEAGEDVTVVCPASHAARPRERMLDGVTILSYAPPPVAEGIAGYVWEFAYCWLRSLGKAVSVLRRTGIDVVHACNPPDTFFLLAALLRPFGVRSVFAQHDLCPELWQSRFEQRGVLGRAIHRALLLLESLSYRVADAVIVPNESYKTVAVRRGRRSPASVFVVRNGPDLGKVMQVPERPELRNGREFLVGYVGIMNPQDGVDRLLRALSVLVHQRGTDVQAALLGAGDMLADLRILAEDLDIADHVTFAGWVSDPHLLSAYLCTADVCVAPDPKTPLNEVSSFMKIMDYMAAGSPIVAFDLRETRVSAGDAALYAEPDDVDDLVLKIDRLLHDPPLRQRMGAEGRRRIDEALAWDHSKPALMEAYLSLRPQTPAQGSERTSRVEGRGRAPVAPKSRAAVAPDSTRGSA